MTITMNAGTNGKTRQSLANEIDRLDRMLDGLAEGLNEAVADAVKAAVGTAVREAAQAVLTEVLTNPEIRARLTNIPTATAAPIQPVVTRPTLRQRLRGLWQGVRSCLAGLYGACAAGVQKVLTSVRSIKQRMIRGLVSLWSKRQAVTQFKYQLLTALGMGVAMGMTAYCAGPWIAAGESAVSGFVATLAVQAGIWMRRIFISPTAAAA